MAIVPAPPMSSTSSGAFGSRATLTTEKKILLLLRVRDRRAVSGWSKKIEDNELTPPAVMSSMTIDPLSKMVAIIGIDQSNFQRICQSWVSAWAASPFKAQVVESREI
jgi:hypothetical protein